MYSYIKYESALVLPTAKVDNRHNRVSRVGFSPVQVFSESESGPGFEVCQ